MQTAHTPIKFLLFFIDGLGLGSAEEENPALELLADWGIPQLSAQAAPSTHPSGQLFALDATGGLPGIPQSATGQASLMCGENAPALLGYHLTALPNEPLVNLIQTHNLMSALAQQGINVTASNLYSQEFFQARQGGTRNRLPVSTLCIQSSQTPFRFKKDYEEGRALFADLTNRFLLERGGSLPIITPKEAAHRMVNILQEADFVFHELFSTDSYAHKGRHQDLQLCLSEIREFLAHLKMLTNPQELCIALVSDHGNCEDPSSANHNRNPVPLALLTENQAVLDAFQGVEALEDVKSAFLAAFARPHEQEGYPPSDWL